MKDFFEWYGGTSNLNRMFVIFGLIIVYSFIKVIITEKVKKRENSERVFKIISVIKKIIKSGLCILFIIVGIMIYQKTNNLFVSVLMAVLYPFLLFLNYKLINNQFTTKVQK